jgi:hypothetical protein
MIRGIICLALAAALGALLCHLLFGECFAPPGPEVFCGGWRVRLMHPIRRRS